MAILHTHRRTLMLLERAKVHLDDDRVVYTEADAKNSISRSWNIPSLNASVVIIGQGSSVTQPAVRKLADDGVLIAFVGTNGTPLICASQSYRPPEKLQAWIERWPSAAWRLMAAKHLQRARIAAIRAAWGAYAKEGFSASPEASIRPYENAIETSADIRSLTGHEGTCTKALYAEAARAAGISWSGRVQHDGNDRANRLLDQGNYLAYGVAGIALWAQGIPPSLPVVHGRSNAGGLVFDLADVIKDAVVLPTVFRCAADLDLKGQAVRQRIIERLYGASFLDTNGCVGLLFRMIEELLAIPAEAKQ